MRKSFSGTAVAVLAAALTVAGTTAAHAGPVEVAAFTLYAEVVRADALANLADTTESVGDNITCDPVPVVDGRMLNPRVGIVAGEVFGQAEIAAHWKCVSLDTGASYTVDGIVTDWYLEGGTYKSGKDGTSTMTAQAGAATANPAAIVQYPGGHPGLNTWHYARFVGTTTTGRQIAGVSELFYVAGL